jgi:hypothetical protein
MQRRVSGIAEAVGSVLYSAIVALSEILFFGFHGWLRGFALRRPAIFITTTF